MKKKKIIILDKPKGCRLANQLWNYISIYAYCLEMGYKCKNFCFYEDKKEPSTHVRSYDNYYKYFNIPNSTLPKLLLWLHIATIKISSKPRLFHRYVEHVKKYNDENIIYSGEEDSFYLPPSEIKNKNYIKQIYKNKSNKKSTVYFDGWWFRNPEGIKKYHKEITKYFKPKKKITSKIKTFIKKERKKYKKIIGVHIRQKDYKILFKNTFYFDQKQVKKILTDYLDFHNLDMKDTLFVVCSDDEINKNIFKEVKISISKNNAVEDLYLLSQTDLVIGTDSTFGTFAAYYGNIPFIVFEKNIEWEYYKNKTQYFQNTKCKNIYSPKENIQNAESQKI